jgi:hypothetical protein
MFNFLVNLNVKKCLSIFLVATYLLAGTQFTELIKIPVLVGHYIEHWEEGKLSFYEFIKIHYSNSENHHESHESDSKLPFKTYQCSSTFAVFPAPFFQEIQKKDRTGFPEKRNKGFSYSFFYSSKFHSSIWQPPRQC